MPEEVLQEACGDNCINQKGQSDDLSSYEKEKIWIPLKHPHFDMPAI